MTCIFYTLKFFSATILALVLVGAIGGGTLSTISIKNNPIPHPLVAPKTAYIAIWASAGVLAVVSLISLIGVLKENFCLTLLAAVLMTVASSGSLYAALQVGKRTKNMYIATGVSAAATLLTFLYVVAIHKRNKSTAGFV